MDRNISEEEKERGYWKVPFFVIGLGLLVLILGTILVHLPSSGEMGAILKASWTIY